MQRLIPVIAFLNLACSWSTTRELLDLTFMDSVPRKFQITSPTIIETGTPFNAIVVYTDQSGSRSAGRFADYLQWEIVGAGSIKQVTPGSITAGVYQTTLIYNNPALTLGKSTSVVLKVTDPNKISVSGITDNITARFPLSLSSFQILATNQAYQSQNFSITVSAIGSDGQTFTNYAGTVNLSPTVTGGASTGVLTPSTLSGFTNGVATANIQFSQPASSLKIIATDQADASKTGTSNGVTIYGDSFTVGAIPIDANTNGTMETVRVSWTKPAGALSYKVYRMTSAGNFTFLGSVFDPTAIFADSDPALVLGTTYTYKVEALNSVGNLLRDSTATVLFRNCTIAPTTISASTTWSYASSPYCVNANITVSGASTVLTIEPGVAVLFGASISLTVSGGAALQSIGTVSLPIIFTSQLANPSPPIAPDYWGGIIIASTAAANNLSVIAPVNEALSETNGTTGTAITYSLFEFGQTALSLTKSAWVENSVFRKNYRDACGPVAGAIYAQPAVSEWVVIRNSVFIDNKKTNCGSGWADIMVTGAGRAVLRYNTSVDAKGYSSNSDGGAFGFSNASGVPGSSTIFGNSFYNAYAARGGGALDFYLTGGPYFIKNNYFYQTQADPANGGVGGAITSTNSFPVLNIQNNIFEGTYATAGGAVYLFASGNTVAYNIFKNTRAQANGGAIVLTNSSSSNIISFNVFMNNYSNYATAGNGGGAVYVDSNSNGNTITRNSFYGTSSQTGSNGGAISCNTTTSSNTISYNHFKDNWAAGSGGALNFIGTAESGYVIDHNNFVNTRKTSAAGALNAFYNTQNTDYTVSNNWWGSVYAATQCQVVAGNLCETTQANLPSMTGNAASAWPLCCAAPLDTNCVGATIMSSGQTCN